MPNRTIAPVLAALLTVPAAASALLTTPATLAAQGLSDDQLEPLVARVEAGVLERAKLAQVMVDKIFSFSELGQQEIETSGLHHGDPGGERLRHRTRTRGHPDGLVRALGER